MRSILLPAQKDPQRCDLPVVQPCVHSSHIPITILKLKLLMPPLPIRLRPVPSICAFILRRDGECRLPYAGIEGSRWPNQLLLDIELQRRWCSNVKVLYQMIGSVLLLNKKYGGSIEKARIEAKPGGVQYESC